MAHGWRELTLGWPAAFEIREGKTLQFEVQAFNLFNHANFYVQNGDGINPLQYNPHWDQLRRWRNAEPDLLSGAQHGAGKFRIPAGNQPTGPATRSTVLGSIHILGLEQRTFFPRQRRDVLETVLHARWYHMNRLRGFTCLVPSLHSRALFLLI